MMQQVFTYFLEQFGRVFEWLNSIELLYGVTLFQYLIVMIILDVVIIIMVPTIGDLHGDMTASRRRDQAREERRNRKRGH